MGKQCRTDKIGLFVVVSETVLAQTNNDALHISLDSFTAKS